MVISQLTDNCLSVGHSDCFPLCTNINSEEVDILMYEILYFRLFPKDKFPKLELLGQMHECNQTIGAYC